MRPARSNWRCVVLCGAAPRGFFEGLSLKTAGVVRREAAPTMFSPLFSLFSCTWRGERNPSGSVSVLQIGNTHLRGSFFEPLSGSPIPWHPVRTSLRTLSDCHRYTVTACSITRHVSAPSRRCCTPFRATLMALTWEGSPVVSQHSYGGVMRHWLCPVIASQGLHVAGF